VKVEAHVIGLLRNYFARDRECLDLPDGATAAELLCRLNPPSWIHRGPLLVVVNQRVVNPSAPLAEGDHVTFMLPVGGG
jgi:sulfur carrier protein ThiS